MTTPDDRTVPAGEPQPPRWDAPPQPPAWDRPAGTSSGWGPPPAPTASPDAGRPAGPTPPGTNTKSVVALVLAVAAYTPTVPFLGAIAALWVSRIAKREIRASGESGLGLCRTADVLAVVHLVLIGLALLALLALVLLPFTFF